MHRGRQPNQTEPTFESWESSFNVDPVQLCDEASSSINLDNADYNYDGAELVGHARRIVDKALNQEIGMSEFDDFIVESARNVLNKEPGRRLEFTNVDQGESSNNSKLSKLPKRAKKTETHEFENVFYPEAYIYGAPESQKPQNEKPPSGIDIGLDGGNLIGDDLSIFTMKIDSNDGNKPTKNQLARNFDHTDFKWLCLGGGIPLTLICGMSNGISYSGPTGVLLGYFIVTPGVLSILACIAEMCAFYPMDGGFTLLVCEYIESSLGLSIGVLYWLNCALTVPIELLQSIKLLSIFPYLDQSDNADIAFLTFFILVLLTFFLFTTKTQSSVIRVVSMASFSGIFILVMILWVICIPSEARRGTALNFWRNSNGFIPNGAMAGTNISHWRQIGHGCSLAVRSYSGIDVPFTVMPEIRNARRSIKSGFRWASFRMLVIYLIVLVSFTFVIDTELWDILFSHEVTKIVCKVKPQWMLQLIQDGVFCSFLTPLSDNHKCTLFYLINAFMVFFGLLDAGIQLYGASRTLHGLGYSGVLWKRLSWCSRERVPVVAVFISTSIATVAYASLGVRIGAVFTYLQLYVTHSYLMIWAVFAWAYIRFYYALKHQQSKTNVRRSAEEYPFKSWFQPWTAILAIIWCVVMYVVTTTEQYYYNITTNSAMWKGNFIAAFLPLVFLGILYVSHKSYFNTKLVRLDQIGIMAAKRKMDAEEWEEDRVYSDGIKERIVRLLT